MEIIVESTKEFEQDLATFTNSDKSLSIKKINHYIQTILNNKDSLQESSHIEQLKKIKLKNQYDSSLYSLKIKPEIRVILTIDEDPIFDKIIITLFKVVKFAEALEAYNSVAKSLYKDLIVDRQEIEFSLANDTN